MDETDDEFEGMFKRLRLDTVEDQVDAYLVAPQEMKSVDPHMWWKGQADSFPVLAKMARDHFSTPATSVPSEQLFSSGGRVVTDFRKSLTSEHIEALLCLQNWILKDFL